MRAEHDEVLIEKVVGRFEPTARPGRSNQTAAKFGKDEFLRVVPGARPATPADVRDFLKKHGYTSGASWVRTEICDGIARWVNVGWSDRAFDAFVNTRPAELKATAKNGVSGLTLSEERLARDRLLDFYFIDLTGGRIGRARTADVIAVRRRVGDGTPVGQCWLRWPKG